MADVNALSAMLTAQSEATAQKAIDLQQLFFAMGQNASEAAAAEEMAPVAFNGRSETVASAKVRLQADLEAQQAKNRAADAVDFNALSISLLDETKALVSQQRELGAKIAREASVSFFDDPATALANAFTIPWDQQALSATTQRLALVNAASESVNAQLTRFSDTTDRLKQSLTQGSIDSLTAGIAAEQRTKALRAHNIALSIDAQGIEATARMSHQALAERQAAYTVVAQAEQQQYMRDQRQAMLEEREEARKNKDRNKALILEEIEFVKDVMREDGILDSSGALRFNDEVIQSGLERKEPFFTVLRDRGYVKRYQGRAAHGESPVDRISAWQVTGYSGQNDVQDTLMALNVAAQNATADEKDRILRGQAAQQKLVAQLDRYSEDVGSGDSRNPLHLPSYGYMATASVLVRNPAYRLVQDLATDEKFSQQATNPTTVYQRLLSGIAARKIGSEDAVAFLTDMGRVARDYNASVGRVYQLTGWDQKKVGVNVRLNRVVNPETPASERISNILRDPLFYQRGQGKTIQIDLADEADVRLGVAKGLATMFGVDANPTNVGAK